MEKVIRDGFVAVLYSLGFGAGWSTWIGCPQTIFDPEVVSLVEKKASIEDIVAYCKVAYHPAGYYGGVGDLTVAWLPVGTKFRITEYDGNESIQLEDEIVWQTA